MTVEEIRGMLGAGRYAKPLSHLYTDAGAQAQAGRIEEALIQFSKLFGRGRQVRLFSAPGRTEVGGNHTDHQCGRVLAASVNLDVLCVASPNSDGVIRIKSEGYPQDDVELNSLELREEENNKAIALIRGIAARARELGYEIGGFDAYTTSNVLKGSGLSSSAAFEVAVGVMLSYLYNDGNISPVTIAQMGQYAENVYFGKPSGLMDQMASSVGGFVTIDFADPEQPVVEPVPFDIGGSGFTLCIVDTVGNHADLTDEYAAITVEMKRVAAYFGAEYLRQVNPDSFYEKLPEVRAECGDRAVLRAMHFFSDNQRVPQQAAALRTGDFQRFKELIVESGRSSFSCLQNVFATSAPQEQGVSLALAVTEELLAPKGAWRVHGGGFGGTIQAFVPNELLEVYSAYMENLFGKRTCHRLSIRPVGGTEIVPE